MMPLIMLWAAYGTDATASIAPVCVLLLHHVAHHLNCLDVRNTMVSMTALSASHDARTGKVVSNDQKIMLHPVLIILT